MTSGSSVTHIRERSIDQARLTATLATLVPLNVAMTISAKAYRQGDEHNILSTAMRLAHRQQLIARARALFQHQNDTDQDPVLSKRAGGSALGRIAIAFQLGFDLTERELADITGRSPDELGVLMANVFSSQAPPAIQPCAEQLPLLGRYRDASLPLEQRVKLSHHVAGCPECADFLRALRERDTAVLAAINDVYARSPGVVPSIDGATRRPWRKLPLIGALTLAGLVILALCLTLYQSLTDREPSQAAVAGVDVEPPVNGWLLRDPEDGGIEALNLDTGWSQPAFPGIKQTEQRANLLSPSGRLLGVWTVTEGNTNRGILRLINLAGQAVRTWEWSFQGFRQSPTAWLNESVLLFSETPIYRSDDDDPWSHAIRAAQDSRLFALDVTTGRRWTVFHGLAEEVIPAPDGASVALVLPPERDRAGETIEIRPVRDDGFGEPVAALAHRYVGASHGPVWAGDGSRVYFAVISESPVASGITPTEDLLFHPANNPVNLGMLTLDGQFTLLSNVETGKEMSPLAASPDGTRIVYIERDLRTGTDDWTIWQARADGSERTPLVQPSGPEPWWANSIVWSSDPASMLLARLEPSSLASTPGSAIGEPMPSTSFIRYDTTFSPRLIRSYPGPWIGRILRWLPSKAVQFDDRTAHPDSANFSGPAPVTSIAPEYRIGSSSARRPDGALLHLDWQSSFVNAPSFWQPETAAGHVAQVVGATDFQWLPDSTGLIGVAPGGHGTTGPSRIVVITGGPTYMQVNLREWFFDPLKIGHDLTRRYAEPIVSPDGAKTALFLVDEQSSRVELWLAQWQREPQRLHAWPFAKVNPQIAAFWVDNQTIMFAEPADWHDGLPRHWDLKQISLSDSEGVQVQDLARFRTHGNETGLTVVEIEPNRDGRMVAVRLRHVGQSGSGDTVDSVHLIPAQDMSHGLEVFRGTPGHGIDWSPDGAWLVAGLGDRLGFVSMNGRQIAYLAGELAGETRFPIWVSDLEIWFDQLHGESHTITSISRR